jgi:hypothetical protein
MDEFEAALSLCNNGDVPGSWQRTKIIPILKPGMDTSNSDSYRPINMLSCARKMFKKIKSRLAYFVSYALWFLEEPWNQVLCGVAFDGHPDVFRVQAADLGGVFGHLWSIKKCAH